MNVHEVKSIETKSILSRLKSKDNYWGIAYNMNLYRGCQHGCIYCVIHVVLAMVLVIFLISL